MSPKSALSALVLMLAMTCAANVWAQSPTPSAPMVTPTPKPGGSSKIPDLSGTWTRDSKRGGFGSSLSLSDPGMRKRGHEDDIPYQQWARDKTLAQVTSTGPEAQFEKSTNPQMWCEPVGIPGVYGWPAKTKFAQTPDAVYILYEYGVSYRIVRLNSKHPEDPDPQWWGDSIGWYENGDTLVVDTVGFNDRTWLDEAAHIHTEKMHLIERYQRVDDKTLRLDITIDDPGAYTKPWNTFKYFTIDNSGSWYQWACTVREIEGFTDRMAKPAEPEASAK
jgi:hypothetical protein